VRGCASTPILCAPTLRAANGNRESFCLQGQDRVSKSNLGTIGLSEQGNPLEPFARECLESLGISLLLDWDILIWLNRRGETLLGVDQIARMLQCEFQRVGSGLDRLESRKLIESSRSSRGVRFYRAVISPHSFRQGRFRQLADLTDSRAGRLTLRRILKPDDSEVVPEVRSVRPS